MSSKSLYILITFITEPWPGNITVGFKSKINCNEFKYSVRSSNTVVPSPSTQSAENKALSSSKNMTIWSVVCPGVWWILKILNSKIAIFYAMLNRHWLRGERFSHWDITLVTTAFYVGILPSSYTTPFQIHLI